jgi:hypothetical protein
MNKIKLKYYLIVLTNKIIEMMISCSLIKLLIRIMIMMNKDKFNNKNII